MRAKVWLVAVCLVTSTFTAVAVADPVRDLVATTVPKSDSKPDDQTVLAKDAVVVSVRGHVQADLTDRFLGPLLNAMGGITFSLSSLKVVEDPRGFAWFYGAIDVALDHDGKVFDHVPIRVNGIAIKNPAWKLAAIMYASPLGDDIIATIAQSNNTQAASGSPKTRGDAALARQAAGWFPKLSRDRSPTADIWAAGTAPKEVAAGSTAATKLVASWDKLRIGATEIDARTFAGGAVGWVMATVRMPLKKNAAEMKLGAVVVKEVTGYKWVALNFTPTGDPARYNPDAR